jgi:hypothetical protein
VGGAGGSGTANGFNAISYGGGGGGAGGAGTGSGTTGGAGYQGIVIVQYEVIPEPSALALVGIGLIGTWLLGRRRRA